MIRRLTALTTLWLRVGRTLRRDSSPMRVAQKVVLELHAELKELDKRLHSLEREAGRR